MASVAIMIVGAVVSAAAITAGNALYDTFGRVDGSEERFRHDRAVEDLQKASDEWNRKRLETLDFINNKIREKSESRNTFDDVDKAIEFYNETHPDANLTLHKQPLLRDFYKAAHEQKDYEVTIVTVLSVVSGYLMFKVYKR